MEKKRQAPDIRQFWRFVVAVIGLVAVIQELRKPAEERSWHGKVANFVPYDFRIPTMERMRDTYWNPEGPVVSPKAFGVGWAPNFGVVKRWFT